MRALRLSTLAGLAAGALAGATFAQGAPSLGSAGPSLSGPAPPPPPASAFVTDAPVVADTCVERIPAGKARPKLTEKVPSRGQSGHALVLSLTVEHLKGETVLPGGFAPQGESAEWRALERAGLFVPDPDGGAGPSLERTEQGDRATTKLELSLVALPKKPGRNVIAIPPLPLSVARASGEVLVLCTAPHQITIEDPIANVSNPMPKPNPPARQEREEWTLLKQAVIGALLAVPVALALAWLFSWWRRRPRPAPPAPPPRPPWEVALEELFDVRHAGLVAEGRLAEHFDRVSDIVRKYLGARYGFDGLESTTREVLAVLRKAKPRPAPLDAIETFLHQADLVKFAKTVPTTEDGELALSRAEYIVKETLPAIPGLPEPPRPEPSAAPAVAPATPDAASPPVTTDTPKASASDDAWKPRGDAS
jgi:hypothetical protein